MKVINIAKDFSRYPSGRYRRDSPVSGQRFRDDFLRPALEANKEVQVVLDGSKSFGSSFLEEAFGGLVRTGSLRSKDLGIRLFIVAESPIYETYKVKIEKYINAAEEPN